MSMEKNSEQYVYYDALIKYYDKVKRILCKSKVNDSLMTYDFVNKKYMVQFS